MEILIVLLAISILALMISLVVNSDLKMDLNNEKNSRSCLRSNFVRYEVKGLKTVYLNELIQYKGKDYEILKDGILFKDLLYVEDAIYTNLEKLIKIK